MAGISRASIQGRIAFGPRAGARVWRVGADPDAPWVLSTSPRHPHLAGCDLHANGDVPAADRARLEQLCRYLLRPAVAQDRVRRLDDGRVVLTRKTAWVDGTRQLVFEPRELLELERYPRATCVAQDGSEPMLHRARPLIAKYGERFKTHPSDLFTTGWLPKQFGPFDAAVSSSCLHNLRDFARISQIYREIREHLRAGGIFLNLDLINAPTAGLRECYDAARARRRHRDGVPAGDVGAMIRSERAPATTGPFPADLDQQLATLKAAGFRDVDCFWKELGRALVGGYA